MNLTWHRTDHYYRQMMALDDEAARGQYFLDTWLQPLRVSSAASGRPMFGGDGSAQAIAQTWGYLGPEDFATAPESLLALEAADAWALGEAALRDAAEAFEPYTARVTIEPLQGWLILGQPSFAMPANRGYSGFQIPGHVIGLFFETNTYNLARIRGLIAHEFHHRVRLNLFAWRGMGDLAEYTVMEGLAESFSAQLYGEEQIGYYAADISAEDLAVARRVMAEGLAQTDLADARSYIFGDHMAERWGFPAVGMPPFGGYAVGYHTVQHYLRATGQTVQEATFVPADEIVRQSGYFGVSSE